jgi:phosphohistidine swiveling domain-containing protein
MHHKGSRGMGSDINGKILRDNDGKVLLPAGIATTCKDYLYREIKISVEDLGLTHEVVVAMREG